MSITCELPAGRPNLQPARPIFDRDVARQECEKAVSNAHQIFGSQIAQEPSFSNAAGSFKGKYVKFASSVGNVTGLVENVYSWGVVVRTGSNPASPAAPKTLCLLSGVIIQELATEELSEDNLSVPLNSCGSCGNL